MADEKMQAEGFLFFTEKDARLAENEQKKIDYLEAHIDYSQPEKILQIYDKAVRDRVFKTPVGTVYLKKLQEYLLSQPEIDSTQVSPIPLFVTYDGEIRKQQNPVQPKIKPSEKKEKTSPLTISVILNILLVIAVIAMFVITLASDQPNILNYERALTNRYAGWEQELTERENTIREKEHELNLAKPQNNQ